jgi:hypothetical protein
MTTTLRGFTTATIERDGVTYDVQVELNELELWRLVVKAADNKRRKAKHGPITVKLEAR